MSNEKEKGFEKTAIIKSNIFGENDLDKINRLTVEPVTEDDVFTFKAVVADNEGDDRNCEPFTRKSLDDMKNLYIGKTVLKDHNRKADSQVGRIYDAYITEDKDRKTEAGESHAELVLKAYMMKTDENASFIRDIQGGIKKEVSTSTAPDKWVCNICGQDNMKRFCPHFPGSTYTVDGEERRCKITIDGVKEAYELSFVPVPAQPRAGVTKEEAEMQSKIEKLTGRIARARIRSKEYLLEEEDKNE